MSKEREAQLARTWVKDGGVIEEREWYDRNESCYMSPRLTLTRPTMDALDALRRDVIEGWCSACLHYFEDEMHLNVPNIRHLQRLGVLEMAPVRGLYACHYDHMREQCQRPTLTQVVSEVVRAFDERDVAQWRTPATWASIVDDHLNTYGPEVKVTPRPTPEHLALMGPVADLLKTQQEPAYVLIVGRSPEGGTMVEGFALNPNLMSTSYEAIGWILSRRMGLTTRQYEQCKASFAEGLPNILVTPAWVQRELQKHPEHANLYHEIMKGFRVRVEDVSHPDISNYGTYYSGYERGTCFKLVDIQPNDPKSGWCLTAETPQYINRGWFDRLVPVYRTWSNERNIAPNQTPLYYWAAN